MPNEVCAAYVEFEFLRLGLFSDINYIYGAQVWNRGGLITGLPFDFGQRVNVLLEGYTNEWIAKWLIDNPQ